MSSQHPARSRGRTASGANAVEETGPMYKVPSRMTPWQKSYVDAISKLRDARDRLMSKGLSGTVADARAEVAACRETLELIDTLLQKRDEEDG